MKLYKKCLKDLGTRERNNRDEPLKNFRLCDVLRSPTPDNRFPGVGSHLDISEGTAANEQGQTFVFQASS